MNLEGEYAVDKSQRAHRIASGIVFAAWIGLAFYTRGMGQAFKTAAYYLLPMSCIQESFWAGDGSSMNDHILHTYVGADGFYSCLCLCYCSLFLHSTSKPRRRTCHGFQTLKSFSNSFYAHRIDAVTSHHTFAQENEFMRPRNPCTHGDPACGMQ